MIRVFFPDPDFFLSRIQGSKSIRSLIPNPDPQHWLWVPKYVPVRYRIYNHIAISLFFSLQNSVFGKVPVPVFYLHGTGRYRTQSRWQTPTPSFLLHDVCIFSWITHIAWAPSSGGRLPLHSHRAGGPLLRWVPVACPSNWYTVPILCIPIPYLPTPRV